MTGVVQKGQTRYICTRGIDIPDHGNPKSIAEARILPWVGAFLLAIVVVQLIEPPPVFAGVDPDRELGSWLALAGSALVLLGGVLRASSI